MQLGRIKDALPKFGVTISSHLADPVPDPPPHCEMFTMAVLLIETVLEKRPEDVPHECHAELAILLAMPGIPEQSIVQIAFGRETGERNVEKMARLLHDARREGMSVDDLVAERSRSGSLPRGHLLAAGLAAHMASATPEWLGERTA